jgi:hypothetical protein
MNRSLMIIMLFVLSSTSAFASSICREGEYENNLGKFSFIFRQENPGDPAILESKPLDPSNKPETQTLNQTSELVGAKCDCGRFESQGGYTWAYFEMGGLRLGQNYGSVQFWPITKDNACK